jgi:excisionase family DNA binding protein
MTIKHSIIDAHAAAAYLGLSRHTIRKYVQRGLIRASGSVGRAYVFDRSELDRYLRDRKPVGPPKRK